MNMQEYWVVGGRYRDLSFSTLEETPEAYGPFDRYEEARRAWSEQSTRTRSTASVRYSIVTTALGQNQAA